MRFEIHTNIPLDFPTTLGHIYTYDNVARLFHSKTFINKINSNELYGVYGETPLDAKGFTISHIVTGAYISPTKEIVFEIEPLDNKFGDELLDDYYNNQLLAKIVARMDNEIVNGKLKLHDIKYVHAIRYNT